MQGSQPDKLHVVVGWLPGVPGRSLAEGAKALAPALLYGDSVTVICPQSDDALEMRDYFDLRDAIPNVVEFDALDSRYPAFDASGQPLVDEEGHYVQQPYAPAVWSHLVGAYLDRAGQALAQGDHEEAHENVARCVVLLQWRYHRDDELVDVLHAELAGMSKREVASAIATRRDYRDEVVGAWLLGAFAEVGSGVGRYPLLDDPSGLLSEDALSQTSARLDRHANRRGVEAALSAAVLRTLPSPDVRADWSELASIRQDLDLPLRRFRAAMAELSIDPSADQLSPDFADVADQILRTPRWPGCSHYAEPPLRSGT